MRCGQVEQTGLAGDGMFPRRGSCYLSALPHQSLSVSFLYSTCHMVVTAEPSWTFLHPTCSARRSESCWVPPCGGNNKYIKNWPDFNLKFQLPKFRIVTKMATHLDIQSFSCMNFHRPFKITAETVYSLLLSSKHLWKDTGKLQVLVLKPMPDRCSLYVLLWMIASEKEERK